MKTVLITGSGQGFGRALFDIYLKMGWKIFPLIRKVNDANMLKNIGQENCFPILTDLRDEDVINKI